MPGSIGIDTFQYTITDTAGETDSATVTVTVGCPDLTGAIDGGGIVTGQDMDRMQLADCEHGDRVHPEPHVPRRGDGRAPDIRKRHPG